MAKKKSRRKRKRGDRVGFWTLARVWLVAAALVVVLLLIVGEIAGSGGGVAFFERVFRTRDLTPRAARVDRAVSAALVEIGASGVTSEMEERTRGRHHWPHWETKGRLPRDVGIYEGNLAITKAVRSAGGSVVQVTEEGPDWRGLTKLEMHIALGDFETHRIVLSESTEEPAPRAPAEDRPKVAIVIDDLGYNRSAATHQLISMGVPVTISILPHTPYTAEIANAANLAGKEVLAHIPMEPRDYPEVNAGEGVLLTSQTHSEIRELARSALEDVPHAVGANNHMGSAFTMDRARMRVVMETLRSENVFFLDSMTTPESVGLSEASRAGVPAVRNRMFIDSTLDEHGTTDVESKLQDLAAIARRRGSAVGIGHPRKDTISALARLLPRMEEQGIELVFVSELVE